MSAAPSRPDPTAPPPRGTAASRLGCGRGGVGELRLSSCRAHECGHLIRPPMKVGPQAGRPEVSEETGPTTHCLLAGRPTPLTRTLGDFGTGGGDEGGQPSAPTNNNRCDGFSLASSTHRWAPAASGRRSSFLLRTVEPSPQWLCLAGSTTVAKPGPWFSPFSLLTPISRSTRCRPSSSYFFVILPQQVSLWSLRL